jgi:PAS domain S-box-containing protein
VKSHLCILHLEDDNADAELLKVTLADGNLDSAITRVETRPEFEKALANGQFDLIISDYTLPGFDGLSALDMAVTKLPDTPFIFSSGTIGEERAIEALLRGATDYVLKDRPARLVSAIRRAVAGVEAANERRQAAERIREQAELLDRAQDAICLLGMDQTILYWNKSAERLYGWSAGEALNRNGLALLFQADPARLTAAQTCLGLSGEWRGDFQQNTKDGRTIVAESRWTLWCVVCMARPNPFSS